MDAAMLPMLCFLPPIGALPRRDDFIPRAPIGGVAATALFTLAVGLALLTPVGWMRSQPVYDLRVGVPSHLGPRAEERNLLSRVARQVGRLVGRAPAYFASSDGYGAVPPGLKVDAATGALVGVPALAGTYTLAVSLSDGGAGSITGPAFKVRVLPATGL